MTTTLSRGILSREPQPPTAVDQVPPDPESRRRTARDRVALAALLAGTAVLYLWNLTASGWANAFYSAAVQAGSQDWTAFFYGASDAAASITVDKPPAALWVMALSVRVFGMPREAGLALAHHLGRALQLTNILRDLDEDAAMGRLYLPREALRDAGIISTDPRTVLAHPLPEQPCNVIVALTFGEFEAANAIMAHHPRRMVRAPRIMGQAYRLILDRLIARGFEPPRAPVRLPRAKILLIVLRNLV